MINPAQGRYPVHPLRAARSTELTGLHLAGLFVYREAPRAAVVIVDQNDHLATFDGWYTIAQHEVLASLRNHETIPVLVSESDELFSILPSSVVELAPARGMTEQSYVDIEAGSSCLLVAFAPLPMA